MQYRIDVELGMMVHRPPGCDFNLLPFAGKRDRESTRSGICLVIRTGGRRRGRVFSFVFDDGRERALSFLCWQGERIRSPTFSRGLLKGT